MSQRRTPSPARPAASRAKKPSASSKKAEAEAAKDPWTVEEAAETYGINHWGAGY